VKTGWFFCADLSEEFMGVIISFCKAEFKVLLGSKHAKMNTLAIMFLIDEYGASSVKKSCLQKTLLIPFFLDIFSSY